MIVDTHVHIASPDRERYPLRPGGVGSAWFHAADADAEHLLALMDRHGVDRTVVVQAVGAYGYDCAYAIDAVRAHPDRLVLVGSVDMDGDDPAAALAGLAAGAGDLLRGVRVFGVLGHEPVWLRDRRADEVWELAGRLGITVVPTIFPDMIEHLGAVVARHPGTVTALDHCAFVDLAPGHPFPAAGPLLALAGLPGLHLKVSSHLLGHARAHGDPAALVDRLAETFGAHRLAWGSDHPQTQDLTYDRMLDLARHSARHLGEDGRSDYLGGTALRVWWPRG
jgi:predicted TIM-barrel fold metal-dependent hydrolase